MKLLILAAAALLLLPAPAGAQGYNPPGTIVVTPPNPEPGDLVRVTVTNCQGPPGSTVVVRIDGIEVGTATLGPTGEFSEEFPVPLESEGEVLVEVDCEQGVLSTIITVVIPDLPFQDPTPTPAPGVGDRDQPNLPRTGSSSTMPLVRAGVSLLAIGTIILFVVAKRREEAWVPRHG